MQTKPQVQVAIQWAMNKAETPLGTIDNAQLRRWARAAFAEDADITLRFVDEDEGRLLNHEFRGKDYATNVLTFPMEMPMIEAAGFPSVVADIVICPNVVVREAETQGKTPTHHLAHLVIHGCLHAQGYLHENDEQANEMEALERKLLKRFRISDPYA